MKQLSKRSFVTLGSATLLMSSRLLWSQPVRMLRWSTDDQMRFAEFFPRFASQYSTPVDCADLAIDSLITFAGTRRLPVRLFDFDGPPGQRKRWLIFDPRRDNWQTVRAYLMQQLGAVNVIENSIPIELRQVRPADLILHENPDAEGYTGHTRVLISATYDAQRDDYMIKRYEGTLPPVIPQLEESWFKDIADVHGGKPMRWNFGQFSMA